MRIICYFISWEGSNIFIVMALMAPQAFPQSLNGIAMTSPRRQLRLHGLKTGMRGEGITFAALRYSATK